VHEKARAEQLVADARQALKDDDASLARTARPGSPSCKQAYHSLGAGTGGGPGRRLRGRPDGSDTGAGNDDIIDAEFTTR
jgi:molecular chaperone DnaK